LPQGSVDLPREGATGDLVRNVDLPPTRQRGDW